MPAMVPTESETVPSADEPIAWVHVHVHGSKRKDEC